MPVSQQENNTYREFVSNIATNLGVFDLQGQEVVWHYTDGEGFLGILQSSTLFATQVAALNDSKETEYATDLFKNEIVNLSATHKDNQVELDFLNRVLGF